uniref:Retroviral polymerase SH3-like domain-containing protein n=1 Tax=Chenopodium quinoa TaxID=63459 RepID=A0A803N0D9_CHEQI
MKENEEGGGAMAATTTHEPGLRKENVKKETLGSETLNSSLNTHGPSNKSPHALLNVQGKGDQSIGLLCNNDKNRFSDRENHWACSGIKENGLYYVDQMSHHGCAALAHGSVEHQLWTWNRRLGHPSLGRNKLAPQAVKCFFVGYGINQKGYRCFDPITNRLYTTMDCDFVETEYFYHHLRSQGESLVDDLSWLTYPELDDPNPTEQVDKATETTDNTLHSSQPNILPEGPTTTLFKDLPRNEVCTPDLCHNPQPTNISSEEESTKTNIPSENFDREGVCHEPEYEDSLEIKRYVLPPRSIRGVPPKRYDQDFEAQRSKYPVSKPSEGNLSQGAKAYNTAVYSETIYSHHN